MTRLPASGSTHRSRLAHRLIAVALTCLALSANGCSQRSYEDVARVANWSIDDLGEIEPQIAQQFSRMTSKLQKSLESGVPDQELAEAVGELAMLHHVYQNNELALEAYRIAEDLDAVDPRWPYYQAVLLEKQGNTEAATIAFRLSLQKDSTNIPARIRLAEIYTRSGEFEAADELYGDLPPPVAGSARALAGMAELALASGEPSTAVELFSKADAVRPNSQRIRLGLGRALQQSGQDKEAREVLESGSASSAQEAELGLLDPMLGSLYRYNISSQQLWANGRALSAAGRPEEAESQIRRALEIVPDSSPFRTDLGAILAAKGDFDGADREYRQVLEADPEYLPALAQLGHLQMQQGKRREAIETYERLLSIDGSHAAVLSELGDLYRVEEDYDAAVESYQRAIDIDARNQSAYVWLAWLQYLQGSPESGLRTLRTALQQLPDSEWLKSLEMRLRSIELTSSEAALAIPEARSLLDGNPTAFNAETLAMIHCKGKELESARQWQSAALAAVSQAELSTEIVQARLSAYQRSSCSTPALVKSDTGAARIPVRPTDLTQ